MEKNYLEISKLLLKIVKQAYALAKKQKINVSDKSTHDLLTNYDLTMEKFILEKLKKHFPNIKIVSEEFNSSVKPDGTYFAIDPLDGTINFGNKLYDRFGIQIGYVENNEIVAGAVCMPNYADFHAAKGSGAFKNGKKFIIKD